MMKTPSECTASTVAILMPPWEVTWSRSSAGRSAFYVNGTYVLFTAEGDLNPPKDDNRREIKIDDMTEHLLRQQVGFDLKAMAARNFPLCGAFHRQIGDVATAILVENAETESEIRMTEAALQLVDRVNRVETTERLEATLNRCKNRHFEIEMIVKAVKTAGAARCWYLVQWKGYEASWESWRWKGWSGKVGDPVLTWEPQCNVVDTRAYCRWIQPRPQANPRRRGGCSTSEAGSSAQHAPLAQAEVETLRDKLYGGSPLTVGAPRHVRCQKAFCLERYDELKQVRHSLRLSALALDREKNARAELIKGDKRGLESEIALYKIQVEDCAKDHKALTARVRQMTCALETAEIERVSLITELEIRIVQSADHCTQIEELRSQEHKSAIRERARARRAVAQVLAVEALHAAELKEQAAAADKDAAALRRQISDAKSSCAAAAWALGQVEQEAKSAATKLFITKRVVSAAMKKSSREVTSVGARAKREAERATRGLKRADKRVAKMAVEKVNAERRAHDLTREATEAAAATQEARREAQAAVDERDESAYQQTLLHRQVLRAQATAAKAKSTPTPTPPGRRTRDEWDELSYDGARMAHARDRKYLVDFFSAHHFAVADIGGALFDAGLTKPLFETLEMCDEYMSRVKALMTQLEMEEWGETFALFLHYEMQLTLAKILQIVQAGCKSYKRGTDFYASRPLLHHPHRPTVVVHVPRLAPPRNKMEPLIIKIQEKLNVQSAEDGSIAYVPIEHVLQAMLVNDPGTGGMPPLSFFAGGKARLPIVLSLDATGFGKQTFNTIALNNPFLSASAANLHILGLGLVNDNRDGSTRLHGPNLATINDFIEKDPHITCEVAPGQWGSIELWFLLVFDLAALRHCEHMAGSGWCMCSRHHALRDHVTKPTDLADMYKRFVNRETAECVCPTVTERYIGSHNTVPGEDAPRPCLWCDFGHDRTTVLEEQAAMLTTEGELAAVKTKAGVAAFSAWRMKHAHVHGNIQPGKRGAPMHHHNMDNQLLDALHMAKLGLMKTVPYKRGILMNASDDARDEISDQLKEWRHPLDCRRKDNGRVKTDKWFSGGQMTTFCAGEKGSPGLPKAIAKLVMIIATDLELRGVSVGTETNGDAVPVEAGAQKKRGKSRGAFTARLSASTAVVAGTSGGTQRPPPPPVAKITDAPKLLHVPTALEKGCDPADLKKIRAEYGSRAQTLINSLLGFDGFWGWYVPYKASVPFLAEKPVKEARAFDNCCKACDMNEIFERVSIHASTTFLPHGAIYKTTRDILLIGDVWAVDTSKLEMQNASTKGVAKTGGSKRLKSQASTDDTPTPGLTYARRSKSAVLSHGVSKPVATKGYKGSMAVSTLHKLLGKKYLRQGGGIAAARDSRIRERLMGDTATGRSTLERAGPKLENLALAGVYDPTTDTCIKAFVRLMDGGT